MNINKVFQSISANMLSEFQHTQTQIKHMGERGSEREAVLKSFLGTYLPSRYGISDGEILDHAGKASRQSDLIIYDHYNCPLLLAGKKVRIFPAESVLAVIEVKSVLTASEIQDSMSKIRQLKNLTRENGPIPAIIFAYRSGWKKDPINKTAIELQKHYRKLQGHEFADLVCILSDGLIALDTVDDGYSIVNNDLSERSMLAYLELDISVLLWFFANLLALLEAQPTTKPFFHRYTYGRIGIVKKTGVVED